MAKKYSSLATVDCSPDFKKKTVACTLSKGRGKSLEDRSVYDLIEARFAGDNLRVTMVGDGIIVKKSRGKISCLLESQDTKLVCK